MESKRSSREAVSPIYRMKKTASVDFSQLRQEGVAPPLSPKSRHTTSAASRFSRRAARGSFGSHLGMYALEERMSCSAAAMQKAPMKSSNLTDGDDDVLRSRPSPTPSASEVERFTWSSLLKRHLSTQTLGKLSIFILLLGSMTSQLKQNSQVDPAASSASSSSLGSAAISSVTDALSPILPFAGGLDLRREDYWSKGTNWWEHIQGVVVQVQDAFATTQAEPPVLSNAAENASQPTTRKIPKRTNAAVKPRSPVMAAQQPFVSLEAIGDLTLGEVGQAFRYAMLSSQEGFAPGPFYKSLSPRVKPVIEALQAAVDLSRGPDADDALLSGSSLGQIDALKFAGALRIFAEWRLLRQVPEGYKGYSVGMSLGQKDVVQNVAKIEHGVHQWLANHPDQRSPSLYQLLNDEIDTHVHARLPRLSEKSSAMGLLWVRRQMEYQAAVFQNVLLVPSKYASGREAIGAAYQQVYDRYHGWAVQKIFNYSFQAAPDPEKIYRHMNPHRLAEANQAARRMTSSCRTTTTTTTTSSSNKNNNEKSANDNKPSHNTDDNNDNKHPILAAFDHIGGEWDKFANHVGGEWDKFANHVGGEWDKLAQNIGNVFDAQKTSVVGAKQGKNAASTEEMEAYVTELMVQDAQEQITAFMSVVKPLLEDIAVMFDTLNMDDPTRV